MLTIQQYNRLSACLQMFLHKKQSMRLSVFAICCCSVLSYLLLYAVEKHEQKQHQQQQ